MKKVFVVLVIAFHCCMTINAENKQATVSLYGTTSDFCDGWKDGYREGYCYRQGYGCLKPLPPLCPLPEIGENTYNGGYNKGFLQGLRDNR